VRKARKLTCHLGSDPMIEGEIYAHQPQRQPCRSRPWPREGVPSTSKHRPTPHTHSSTEAIRLQTATAHRCVYSTRPHTSLRSSWQTRHDMRYSHILGNKATSPTLHHRLTRNRGEGEVLFSDIRSYFHTRKKGWDKIRGCCRLAASQGHR
jgi:hypothetical protein